VEALVLVKGVARTQRTEEGGGGRQGTDCKRGETGEKEEKEKEEEIVIYYATIGLGMPSY